MHPALENARLAIQLEAERNDDYRHWRALMLAPTIEIWAALLRGETVPLGALDQKWVKRFGLRS